MYRTLTFVLKKSAPKALLLFGACLFSAPGTASAQSLSQLQAELSAQQATLQSYEYYYNANRCGSGGNSQVCSLIVQAINNAQKQIQNIQQEIASLTGGGGGGEDPCEVTRNYIAKTAASSYNHWYPIIYSNYNQNYYYFTRGYAHGYYFYYATPPIYCGQTQYTQAPRPYYCYYYEVFRVLSQFYNNGYEIVGTPGIW